MSEMVEKYDVNEIKWSAHKEVFQECINNTLMIVYDLKNGIAPVDISKKYSLELDKIIEIKEQLFDNKFDGLLGLVEKCDIQETKQIAKEEGKKEGLDISLMIIQDIKKGLILDEISKRYNVQLDKITQIQNLLKEFENA